MNHDFKRTLIYTALLSVALVSGVASAQDTAAPSPANEKKKAQASDTPQTLEGITVTAAKREQDIQKVPISMTALTGEQLERQGVTSLVDLARIAPSLTVAS